MRKNWKLFSLLLLFVFSFSFFAFGFTLKTPEIYVNNVKVPVKARVVKGVVFLPVYILASILQVDIERDFSLNIVKINGELIDAIPYETPKGELLLPVESVAKSLGAIYLVGKDNTIRVDTKGSTQVRPPQIRPVIEIPSPTSSETAFPKAYTPPSPSVYTPPYPGTPPTPSVYTPPSPSAPPSPSVYTPSYPGTSPTPSVYTPSYPSQTPAPSVYTPPYPSSTPAPSVYTPSYPSSAPTPSVYNPPYPSTTPTPPVSPPFPATVPGIRSSGVFVPKTQRNNVFQVAVTNLEVLEEIKGYYKPRPGNMFIILYVSQQNISNEVQIYTGNFIMQDQNGQQYHYAEGLSNFWLVILSPGGTNFGYLVFEVPRTSVPYRVILRTVNQPPLTLNLQGG